MVSAKMDAQVNRIKDEAPDRILLGNCSKPPGMNLPERRGLTDAQVEFEAETISYLVCRRNATQTKSEEYLALKTSENVDIPPISLDTILKVVSRIEGMG